MADQLILLDTSILIDLFRKTDKANSVLVSLVNQGYKYCISAVTDYEIYSGSLPGQLMFWNHFLETTEVLAFDKKAAKIAVELNKELKRKRNLIDTADIFIAATAISHNLSFATLNRKHFIHIDNLLIVE